MPQLIAILTYGVVVNTSFEIVYDPTLSFNVTAGTGRFDGKYVAPTMAIADGSLSYWVLATSSTFLDNSQFSCPIEPVSCVGSTGQCESYLLAGGLQSMSPNPPKSNKDSIVIIYDSPASQVEFASDIDERDHFSTEDCVVYGNKNYRVGVELCLAPSVASKGSIIAGKQSDLDCGHVTDVSRTLYMSKWYCEWNLQRLSFKTKRHLHDVDLLASSVNNKRS